MRTNRPRPEQIAELTRGITRQQVEMTLTGHDETESRGNKRSFLTYRKNKVSEFH